MKKATKIVAYSFILICCSIGASVITTNYLSKLIFGFYAIYVLKTPRTAAAARASTSARKSAASARMPRMAMSAANARAASRN